ncbi:MAG TPA: efflux RND transporter periplasmic adaptor subunit [Candidatus Eisenbacteria bacterium]|nr:efflux RND transporter periplasmic adaptor subunit [Candidatus Eisenbacteria bacterium]
MKARTRNIILISAGALLLVVIVVANIVRAKGGQVAVQAAAAKRAPIASTVRAPGRVQPETMVKMSANVPGEVVRLAVKEGDHVRKGQFLLQLDDTQYRAQVRESRAALEAARSNLRLAEAAFAQTDASLKRKEALFEQKLVSPEELDIARTQRNSDRARVDGNKEEVQRAEATLQSAEDTLRKTRYSSPINGTVTQVNIEQGEIAVIGTMNNPGTVILTVANMNGMKVESDVDETDVTSVRLGQTATVKIDAFPDTTFTGVVVEIANSPKIEDQGTQEQQTNFEVDVRIDAPPPTLRPGMTADVEIKTASKDSVTAVPIQSVVVRTPEELEPVKKGRRKKGKVDAAAASAPADPARAKKEEIRGVFVIVDGKAQFRKVKTGIASDTDFEIDGDVKPGEKVVTGPFRVLRTLKPGTAVKIEEARRPEKEKK